MLMLREETELNVHEQVRGFAKDFHQMNRGEQDVFALQAQKLLQITKEALKAEMYQELYSEEQRAQILACTDAEDFMNEIFPKLTPVQKKDLHKAGLKALARPIHEFLHYYESSGTTGNPVPAPKTVHDLLWNTVNIGEMWGTFLQKGDVALILINAPFAPAAYQFEKVMEYLGIMSFRPWIDNITGDYTRVLRLMEETKTNVFVGPPSRLLEMIQFAHKANLPLPQFDKFIVMAEQAGPSFIHRLEKLTGGSGFVGSYGSSETATIAASCSHKKMHVLLNSYFLELFDGEEYHRLGAGVETGELVITTLDFQSKPLIRYHTGDKVRMDYSSCGCGSCLPTLQTLGRAQDVISFHQQGITQEMVEKVLWSDEIIQPAVFNYMMVLKGNHTICLVTTDSDPSADWIDRLESKLQELFVEGQVTVRPVKKLPPLASLGAYLGWKLARVLDLNEAKNWERLPEPIYGVVKQTLQELEAEQV